MKKRTLTTTKKNYNTKSTCKFLIKLIWSKIGSTSVQSTVNFILNQTKRKAWTFMGICNTIRRIIETAKVNFETRIFRQIFGLFLHPTCSWCQSIPNHLFQNTLHHRCSNSRIWTQLWQETALVVLELLSVFCVLAC